MNNTNLINGNYTSPVNILIGSFTAQVFGWMSLGLALTGIVGFFIDYLINNTTVFDSQLTGIGLVIVFILEIVLVFVLSIFWRKFNALITLGLFLLYSCVNGIFIGFIIASYPIESVIIAFGLTSVIFLILALYGIFTKSDLTRWGNIALFGLFGIVMASLVNIFIYFINPNLSNGLYWITTYAGVVIFLILIAFDAQRLKNLAMEAQQNNESTLKYSIQGALILYLDFINLFIRVLAIVGGNKRRR